MRNRNVHIQFWLNRKEAESLDKAVKKSGLSREAYLRHLIAGLVPRDAPPTDYYAMMRELYRVGTRLEQAGADTAALRAAETAIRKITAAVVLPRPLEP